MMKTIYTLLSRLMPTMVRNGVEWHCDPLSHPAIRTMSPEELADLPLASMRKRD